MFQVNVSRKINIVEVIDGNAITLRFVKMSAPDSHMLLAKVKSIAGADYNDAFLTTKIYNELVGVDGVTDSNGQPVDLDDAETKASVWDAIMSQDLLIKILKVYGGFTPKNLKTGASESSNGTGHQGSVEDVKLKTRAKRATTPKV